VNQEIKFICIKVKKSRDIPEYPDTTWINPGIKSPGIMSPQLSRDKKIPGLGFPEYPGSKRLNKSRDFGIPRCRHGKAHNHEWQRGVCL
jgi:hypothetical protein